jgi:hypothetical protein
MVRCLFLPRHLRCLVSPRHLRWLRPDTHTHTHTHTLLHLRVLPRVVAMTSRLLNHRCGPNPLPHTPTEQHITMDTTPPMNQPPAVAVGTEARSIAHTHTHIHTRVCPPTLRMGTLQVQGKRRRKRRGRAMTRWIATVNVLGHLVARKRRGRIRKGRPPPGIPGGFPGTRRSLPKICWPALPLALPCLLVLLVLLQHQLLLVGEVVRPQLIQGRGNARTHPPREMLLAMRSLTLRHCRQEVLQRGKGERPRGGE